MGAVAGRIFGAKILCTPRELFEAPVRPYVDGRVQALFRPAPCARVALDAIRKIFEKVEARQPVKTFAETAKAYLALTKPRVIELLLVATIPAMLQAARGEVNFGLILLTLIGGWMGAGAANTFNNVVDHDIDQLMRRTRRRPTARQTVSVGEARVFAWVLLIASVLWLGFLCHSWLAAGFIVLTLSLIHI